MLQQIHPCQDDSSPAMLMEEKPVISRLLDELLQTLHADHCFLIEVVAQRTVLPIRLEAFAQADFVRPLYGTMLSEAVIACLQKKFLHQILWAVDIQGSEPDEFYRWSKEYCNARAVISCPIISSSAITGILVLYTQLPRQWCQEDLQKMQEYAQQAQHLLTDEPSPAPTELSACYVEESLWNFFANGPVGFQWLDTQGRVLRINNAGLQMLGYSENDYINQQFTNFCADSLEGHDFLQRIRNTEVLRCYPIRLRCKHGRIKNVQISTGIYKQSDQIVYTRCLIRDITTEQSQTEHILRQSQERYWSLYEWERKTREVLHIIRESLEMDRIFSVSIEEMAKALQADRAFIVEFDEGTVCSIRHEYRTHPTVKPFKGMVPPWDFCPYLATSARNEIAYSTDTFNDTTMKNNVQWEKFSRRFDIRGIITAPILYQNRLMNVIVFHTLNPRVWNEHELFFVKVLSEHLSSVFYQEKQRLDALNQLKNHLQTLQQFSQECQEPFRQLIDYALIIQQQTPNLEPYIAHIAQLAPRLLTTLNQLDHLSQQMVIPEKFFIPAR